MKKNRLRKLLLPLILEQLLAVSVGMVDTFMVSTVGQVAVSGVATLISRAVAGIIMKLLLLSERNRLRITEMKMYKPTVSLIKKILSIGIPSGIENGMFQIGKLLVVSMVATLGTDAIAANSIGYQIIDFPNIPGMSIGLALVVIVGQDIGAGDKELAVKDSKRLLKLAYIGDWTCKILLLSV